jgi:peptide/nickel transport system ATP-binding protein
VLRAIDPTDGQVLFRAASGNVVDVAAVPRGSLRPLRREMQMIFQDPFSSLNPRMTLLDIVGEPLLVHGVGNHRERMERVAELLRLVGLRPEYMRRFPHAFSGGQRQRIGIARALALNPRLVVADEAVSALDVSVQAQILNLLLELQERLGLTYLFVAHDLSVVKHISDRVAVMYVGQMVELAETQALFASPKHPYTSALLSAIPEPDPRARPRGRRGAAPTSPVNGAARERVVLQGEVANPAAPPSGCYFHPRCPYAVETCKNVRPVWEEIEPGRFVRCHRARELNLTGVAGT